MKKLLSVFGFVLGFAGTVNAQVPTAQDCLGAIPICQNVYSTSVSYSGTGNYTTEINSANSCLGAGEKNDVWYTFSVQQTGNLNFLITPNTSSDDYDWAVYNLTNNSCADIYNGTGIEVSCNFSSTSGTTGPNGGSSLSSQSASGTPYNAVIPVVAGQTYVVNVSNFSSSQSGYTIDFGASSAVIFDNVPPVLTNILSTPGCGSSTIQFEFSEWILCSTVSAADFTVTGPGGPYTVTGVTGAGCASGGTQEKIFTITVSPAITTSGAYNLNLVTTAGSVTDLCGNVALANSIPFNVSSVNASITTHTDANCGSANGSATATGSGGAGTYTYTWNTVPVQNTATAFGLLPGNYIVTVSDGSCSDTAMVTISNIGAPTLTLTVTHETCSQSNGQIACAVTGGSGTYTYLWSTTPAQATATATSLPAGSYTVTVNDGTCTAVQSATVNNSPGPSLSITGVVDATCGNANGSATVNVTAGGTGPFTYTWSTTPVQSTATATNLASGAYTVTVEDANHCIALINANINDHPAFTTTIQVHNADCGTNNGAAVVNAIGGSGTYTYTWNSTPVCNNDTVAGLGQGTYVVTVYDGFCTVTDTAVIGLNNAPILTMSSVDETCGQGDGSASVSVVGGSGTYTYSWSSSGGSNPTMSNVHAGSYTVTVSDGVCAVSSSVQVDNIPGPDAAFTVTPPIVDVLNPLCMYYDNSTGSPVSWTWDFGDNSSASTQNAMHSYMSAGTYDVVLTIEDINGCRDSATLKVTVNDITTIYVPNAFTPNENGLNETWGPKGTNLNPDKFHIWVYNRWGELIWETDNVNSTWNGTYHNQGEPVQQGVYAWKIMCKNYDGTTSYYDGHVTVVK